MNDFIQGLITKGEDVIDLKSQIKKQEKTIKYLEDIVDDKDIRLDSLNRSQKRNRIYFERELEDIKDLTARKIEVAKSETEGKVKEAEEEAERIMEKVEFESKRDILRTKDTAENRVRRIKEEHEHRITIMKEEHESDIAIVKVETSAEIQSVRDTAQADADDRFIKVIDGLKSEVTDAEVRASGAEASAEERRGVIETLQGELAKHDELIRFVMTKLPNVDLSKFNINVEIPAPEVVVVGGKGGNQAKKDK